MRVGLICIGDELLKGSVINTNMAYIGRRLLETGLMLSFSMEVADTEDAILSALDCALEKVDIVITSGGLGPTADDVTKEFIARRFGYILEQNGEAAINITRHWRMRNPNEEMPTRIMNQSLVPAGATVIQNKCGTAPGLIMRSPKLYKYPDKSVILLPGPPNELEPMFESAVVPYIKRLGIDVTHSKLYHICGLGESEVEELMLPVINAHHGLSVAYCASFQFVKLFLTGNDEHVMASAMANVREIFSDKLLSDGSASLADEILTLLREKGLRISFAESCTGGLLSKLITDIAGSSDVFMGSVVSYDNSVKTNILGVQAQTLADYGAVSMQCAREMAEGVASRLGTECAISITGIAGPSGGTPEKPVGLVYAGIKLRERVEVFELRLRRSREQIRERAAGQAFNKLRMMLKGII